MGRGWGVGGGGGGAKEERVEEFFWRGGHAWEFLLNFSKVTENAFITIKLLFFTSLVMLLSGLKIYCH